MKALTGVLLIALSASCSAAPPNNAVDLTIQANRLDTIEISVIRPDGTPLSMRDDRVRCPGARVTGQRVDLQFDQAVGRDYETGKDIPVFTSPGTYRVFVSDNLETDIENADAYVRSVTLTSVDASRFSNTVKAACASIR